MILPIVLFVLLFSLTANVNSQTIISNYAGTLDTSDRTFTRYGGGSGTYYYEAIRIVVDTTGTYTFMISSSTNMNTYGYLYTDPFDSQNPSVNLMQENDNGTGNLQYQLTATLQASIPYVLVVTSHSPSYTGSYSVAVTGPENAQMSPIDPLSLTTTTTTTTSPPVRTSSYSSMLTTYDRNYTRYGCSGTFYYRALQLTVSTTGLYTFRSSSVIPHTYIYLYQGNFYPQYPQYNIIIQDDDSSGNYPFRFTVILRSYLTYILVFTTYSPLATGAFNITITGPDFVNMLPTI